MLALLCFVLLPYFLRIKIYIRIGLFKTEFDWVRSGGRCPGDKCPAFADSRWSRAESRRRALSSRKADRMRGGRGRGDSVGSVPQHCGLRRDVGRSVGSDRAHRSCLFLSRQDGSAAAAGQAGNSCGGRRMRDICPSPTPGTCPHRKSPPSRTSRLT